MSRLSIATLLLLAPFVIVYVIRCAWWPLKRCRKCHGEGKRKAVLRRGVRLCPRCRGVGQSVRLGRVVVDRIRTTRAAERKAAA